MDRPQTLFQIAKCAAPSATAQPFGITVLVIWLLAYGAATVTGQDASSIAQKAGSSRLASAGQSVAQSTTPATSPAPQSAPPAEEPKKLSLSVQAPTAAVNTSLTLTWEANYAPSRLDFFYSANDGRTWMLWREQPLEGQQSGSVDLPVEWPQFNWSYFSYSKIRDILSPGQDAGVFARLFGNPLQVRVSDPSDQPIKESDVVKLVVTGPPWATPVYVGTFLFAWLLFYIKTRWEETPRRNLTEIFGLSCTACLLSKTTFLLPFAIYLVAGLMIYHRFRIITKEDRSKYWLTTVYQWTVIGIFLASIATIIIGLVLRVRDLLF